MSASMRPRMTVSQDDWFTLPAWMEASNHF